MVIDDIAEVIRKLVIVSSHKEVKVIHKHHIISNYENNHLVEYFNYILKDMHNNHYHEQQFLSLLLSLLQ